MLDNSIICKNVLDKRLQVRRGGIKCIFPTRRNEVIGRRGRTELANKMRKAADKLGELANK